MLAAALSKEIEETFIPPTVKETCWSSIKRLQVGKNHGYQKKNKKNTVWTGLYDTNISQRKIGQILCGPMNQSL